MLTANGATGLSHDFFCYDATGNVWNGTAFVAWVDANYATYRIPATQRGTSGTFTGTAPAGTANWEMRVQGASLAGSYVVWAGDDTATNAATAATQSTTAASQATAIKAKTDLIGTLRSLLRW